MINSVFGGVGGAGGKFNKDFLEEMTTEPKKVNSSIPGRLGWGEYSWKREQGRVNYSQFHCKRCEAGNGGRLGWSTGSSHEGDRGQ